MEILAAVIFCAVYSLETVLICLGNIFIIFIFWKHRAKLKRTSYLLVNLAFADLLVAISSLYFLSFEVRDVVEDYYEKIQRWEFATLTSWDVFCGASSLLSLLVIACERLYAIRWPFLHRALSTRTYIYSPVFVWITAGLVSVFYLTMFTVLPEISDIISVVSTLFILVVLILICVGYLLICLHARHNIPEGVNELRRANQNKKLTKTLLIVTVISLVCWFPSIVLAIAYDYTNHYPWSSFNLSDKTHNVLRFFKVMQCGNSLVNPIVYSFTMPFFKSEIKERFSKLTRVKNTDSVSQNKRKGALSNQGRQANVDQAFFETKL